MRHLLGDTIALSRSSISSKTITRLRDLFARPEQGVRVRDSH